MDYNKIFFVITSCIGFTCVVLGIICFLLSLIEPNVILLFFALFLLIGGNLIFQKLINNELINKVIKHEKRLNQHLEIFNKIFIIKNKKNGNKKGK